MDILQTMAEELREGQAARVAELVRKALDEGMDWKVIMDKGLFAGMEVVGNLFREEDIFIPEVLMAAKAMQAGVDVLEPLMMGAGEEQMAGKVVLGTVKGDVHDLGKNLVGIMLRGAGFEVIDIGVDVSADKFVSVVAAEKPQIVGMSALLTTTMPQMKTTISALRQAGFGQVKVMIGGACVTQKYADEIGADGYAENAGAAVGTARKLVGIGRS
ncbi:MAG: corrinoid protein [Chloroflexota bacterium]